MILETEWAPHREELPSLVRLLIQIGSLHRRMQEYEAAELYLSRAQELAERDPKAFAAELGGIYRELGDLKATPGDTDEALRFQRKAESTLGKP